MKRKVLLMQKMNDMYGSQKEAVALTKTATAVISVLQGKKSNLKDGDKLDVRGMSKKQMSTFVNRLFCFFFMAVDTRCRSKPTIQ